MNRYRDEFLEHEDFEWDAAQEVTGIADCSQIPSPLINHDDSVPKSLPGLPDADVARILVLTDNHLGFKIDDPIRGMISFEQFEEALALAELYDVDFIVHGGDLFDIAKPNRYSLNRCITAMKDASFGAKVSAMDVTMPSNYARPNTQDETINVSRPIFMIHGNHDDPIEKANLSVCDTLHSSGLINYFGKAAALDDIHVKPIIIQKGVTKVALYGLGNIRDERLHRAFNDNLVTFHKPKDDESNTCNNDDDEEMNQDTLKDHFALMLIHQNRFRGARGGMLAKNCIHDYQLPSFLDLVVWGHEHDCVIEPTPSANQAFHIVQPGSSLITSYQPAEASRPKHVAIIEVLKKRFRVLPVCLTGEVYLFEDICLHDVLGDLVSGHHEEVKELIEKYLHEKIEHMIRIAEEERHRRQSALEKTYIATADALGYRLDEGDVLKYKTTRRWWQKKVPTLENKPLIRLRVDHYNPDGENYPTLPIQRFGSRYSNVVGNHQALLLFTTRSSSRSRTEHGGDAALHEAQRQKITGGLGIADLTAIMEERRDMGGLGIETVIDQMITLFQDKPCKVLLEPSMNRALHTFVQKEDSTAIEGCLEQICHGAREEVLRQIRNKEIDPLDDHALGVALQTASSHHRSKMIANTHNNQENKNEESDMGQGGMQQEAWPGGTQMEGTSLYRTANYNTSAMKRLRIDPMNDRIDDDDDEDMESSGTLTIDGQQHHSPEKNTRKPTSKGKTKSKSRPKAKTKAKAKMSQSGALQALFGDEHVDQMASPPLAASLLNRSPRSIASNRRQQPSQRVNLANTSLNINTDEDW